MYEVTISKEGIISKIQISAENTYLVQEIITNMYGQGKVQIINIRRI